MIICYQMFNTSCNALIFNTALMAPKATLSTQGVQVMTMKPKYKLESVKPLPETNIVNAARYRARSLPIAGALLKDVDRGEEQMTLL